MSTDPTTKLQTSQRALPQRPEVSAASVSTNTGPDEAATDAPNVDRDEPPRQLSAIARQALAEAEERRRAHAAQSSGPSADQPRELGGRKGPDPVRYGDWENGGIASDF